MRSIACKGSPPTGAYIVPETKSTLRTFSEVWSKAPSTPPVPTTCRGQDYPHATLRGHCIYFFLLWICL